MRWSDVAADPNDAAVLRRRQEQLDRAWYRETRPRVEVLEELCRDRTVLDVGCVAHDDERWDRPSWLHGRVAAVARECLGVDNDAAGVEQLRRRGYDVRCVDIADSAAAAAALRDRSPFDVVVAGEVIEHLPNPQALLAFATGVLGPDGRLVVTTPNPYAPWRVRAGQRGEVWENADHVTYLFPAGMVELAERTGLTLTSVTTVGHPFTTTLGRSTKVLVAAMLRTLRGAAGPGSGRLGLRREYLSPIDLAGIRRRRAVARVGETTVYVLALGRGDTS